MLEYSSVSDLLILEWDALSKFQLNLGLGICFISVADKLDCSHGCKPTHLKWGQSSPRAGAKGRNGG